MILPYFIAIPLLSAFLISFIAGKKDYWAVLLSTVAAASMLILSAYALFAQAGETQVYEMGLWKLPVGIVLVQDALTCLMLVLVSLISFTSLIYSVSYIRHLDQNWKYYALFMLLVTGMNGVIVTGDLFNLFVFMEIALLSAFALVAYGGRSEEYEAAFKYAIMGTLSSALVLMGIAVLYSATSTLTMAKISQKLTTADPRIMTWVGGLFLAGLGLKAALIPFHAWLPDAHSSAPAPISSMLSGVLIKVLGIYAMIRLYFNVFGAPELYLNAFLVLGAISIILGGLLSVVQWDMKRLLAYSSISQIGYILVGLGIGTELGVLGALFHLMSHAIFKSLLFYNAGAVEMALGTRDLRKMGALSKLLPVTSGTSLIASLSISGIPPFNGFISKLIIIIALIQAGATVYAVLAIVGSILTLGAMMKMQRYGFRGEKEFEKLEEKVGWRMQTAMIILAVLCVATGLLMLPGIRESVLNPVVSVIVDNNHYTKMVMGR